MIDPGRYIHAVTPQAKTIAAVGSDGYSETWAALMALPWWVSIESATPRVMERIGSAGATESTATHVLEGAYLATLTTACRIVYGSRVFSVRGVVNWNERNETTFAVCEEVVQ